MTTVNQRDDVGTIKQLFHTFYGDKHPDPKTVSLAIFGCLILGYGLKSTLSSKLTERSKHRSHWIKLYYKTHCDTLQFINIVLRVHVPLTINSMMIISRLRYLRRKGVTMDFGDISIGYPYGVLNFLICTFVLHKFAVFLYRLIPRPGTTQNHSSDNIAIQIFERFILSPAESQLVTQMSDIDKVLRETLGHYLEDIDDLQDIIWEYMGPIDDFDDYQEFEDIVDYVRHLKSRFVDHQKCFNFEEHLIVRAFDWFDVRKVTALSIWKINSKHTNQITITVVLQVIAIVVGQIMTYLMRLFGKLTLSQLWYICILEGSGNHELLHQYLYCLLGREPLYLLFASPVYLLRLLGVMPRNKTEGIEHWIVGNLKGIVYRLFGRKGLK